MTTIKKFPLITKIISNRRNNKDTEIILKLAKEKYKNKEDWSKEFTQLNQLADYKKE